MALPKKVDASVGWCYCLGYIKFVEGNPLDAAFSADPQQVSSKAFKLRGTGSVAGSLKSNFDDLDHFRIGYQKEYSPEN